MTLRLWALCDLCPFLSFVLLFFPSLDRLGLEFVAGEEEEDNLEATAPVL